MNKTFYARNFQIAFALLASGKLVGLLQPKKIGMMIHEFNGLYEKYGTSVRLSFYIDWKLSNNREKAFTAFTGVMAAPEEKEVLKLKWLLLSTRECNKNSISSGVEILTRNIADGQALFNPDENIPFPTLDTVIKAEFN